jgi:hypothetical protein
MEVQIKKVAKNGILSIYIQILTCFNMLQVWKWLEFLKCKTDVNKMLSSHVVPIERCIKAAMSCVEEEPEK